MVEIHYEEVRAEGPVHWRVVVNDLEAATAQVAQDIADGRTPLQVVEGDDPKKPKWDVNKQYDPAEWKALLKGAKLHERARAVGPVFGD